MSSPEPSSTSLPRYMTPIRLAMYLTTARSWEMTMKVRSWSACSRFIRLSTWALIETSRALTAGELVRVPLDRVLRQSDLVEQLVDPLLLVVARADLLDGQRLPDDRAD